MWGITASGSVNDETDYYIRSALGTPGYTEVPYGGTVPSGDVWY
jgi:hypothetical protein